jgi:hypothetical protein
MITRMDQRPKEQSADTFIQNECELLRDQIAAAWQLHVERVEEELQRGWKSHVASALERRFAALAARFDEEVERRAALRAAKEIAAARRGTGAALARAVRRIEQSADMQSWTSALLDAAVEASERVALFSTLRGGIRCEGHRARGGADLAALEGVEARIESAPAIRHAVETMDAVLTQATPSEMSEALAAAFGASDARRVALLPVATGRTAGQRRVQAVLAADASSEAFDLGLLEICSAVAGLALDCLQAERSGKAGGEGGLLNISMPAAPAAPIPPDEEEIHARARRFARVRVSEMRLYHPQSVREGRERGRLYEALRDDMDRARADFREQFMRIPSMTDYFHEEVVRSLANHDEALLGPEYPGPLG